MNKPDVGVLKLVNLADKKEEANRTFFDVACGSALDYFLKGGSWLNWLCVYPKNLFTLNPYQYAFTKKVGTLWLIFGPRQSELAQSLGVSRQLVYSERK